MTARKFGRHASEGRTAMPQGAAAAGSCARRRQELQHSRGIPHHRPHVRCYRGGSRRRRTACHGRPGGAGLQCCVSHLDLPDMPRRRQPITVAMMLLAVPAPPPRPRHGPVEGYTYLTGTPAYHHPMRAPALPLPPCTRRIMPFLRESAPGGAPACRAVVLAVNPTLQGPSHSSHGCPGASHL